MFRSKTVFVLGAGSSAEVDMPVGETLKDKISDKLNIEYTQAIFGKLISGDRGIARAFLRHSKDQNNGYEDNSRYVEKAQSMRRALPHAISIDNLLDAHRGDEIAELCGKLGIFQSILESERNSRLFSDADGRIKFEQLNGTWFSEFVKILTEDVSKNEFDSLFTNVSFINFNYDRCLEHYLLHALSNYYDIDEKTVAAILKNLKVLRPYGSVGMLPWQNSNSNWTISFGSDKFLSDNDLYEQDKGEALLRVAKQIKTFNEKQHSPSDLEEMHGLISDADKIVFLGFAFHRQNLELITPHIHGKAKNIFTTTLGISSSDLPLIQTDLLKLLSQQCQNFSFIQVINSKCSNLFKEYRRSLTG